MAKTSCKIERTNMKCAGHSGWGRYNLISGDGKRCIHGKTENQASMILGKQVMLAYSKFCLKNDVSMSDDGVELVIEFKKYSRKAVDADK